MIHPKATITWLDQSEGGIHYTDTIDGLFQKYADRVHVLGKNISVIAFGAEKGPKIQIQDWTGWTNVMTVWKHVSTGEKWTNISVVDHPDISIKLSEYELVPFYEPDCVRKGFHGEVKYAYRLKNPSKILSTDRMRVRNVEEFFPEHPQFARVNVESIGDDSNHGYQIYTLSSFVSANGFHLYGSDELDVNRLIENGRGYK